jgi:hypothetical protein
LPSRSAAADTGETAFVVVLRKKQTQNQEVLPMATAGATRGDVVTSRQGVAHTVRRLTTETKQAFKTTEFWAMVGLVVAILISAAVINGGDNGTDEFIARQAWLYVSILGAGYFVSRGLAKSGSREPYTADPDDRDNRGDGGAVR